MKKSALLLLFLIMVAVICSCDTLQDITGDTVYHASSDVVVSTAPKNWVRTAPGNDIKMFTVTNNTDISFNAVEFKPYGYDGWETMEYDFVAGEQFSCSFAKKDLEKYKKWDFRMRIDFDLYYTISDVDVSKGDIVLNGSLESPTYEMAVAD